MIQDPYKVLGLSPDASDEEVKRAYRQLAKKYHPDANPGDAEAARKMQEINAAYDQIKNPAAAQQNRTSGGYEDYDPFRQWRERTASSGGRFQSNAAQAAYRYLQYRRYQEALNALSSVPAGERGADWYYLSALANDALGNRITAMEHIRRAVSMSPEDALYRQTLAQMEQGGAAYREQTDDFGGFGGRDGSLCLPLCFCFGSRFCCTPFYC